MKIKENRVYHLWLLIVLVVIGYITFTISQIKHRGLFEYIGIDYRLWYASSQILRDKDIWSIYNLENQSKYQKNIYDQYSRFSTKYTMSFFPLRIPYLPIFVLPFRVLSLFPVVPSFVLYTILNAVGTAGYLWLWIKRISFQKEYMLLFFCVGLLSISSFLNLLFAQVNLILLIFIGEMLYALEKKKDFLAGILLSLCLIKPQILFPLFPIVMIVFKAKRFFQGFIVGAAIILVSSIAVGKFQSISNLANLLISWPTELDTSGMTWRSFTLHLEMIGVEPSVSLLIGVIIGLLALLSWGKIILFVKTRNMSNLLDFVYGATLLTQFIVSPYGNVHMALPLTIFWYKLLSRNRRQTILYSFLIWSLFTAFVFLILSLQSVGVAHDILGRMILGAHILMLLNYISVLSAQPI